MIVLVTGGSGFIGYHIVEQLLEQGAGVRVLDLEPCADPRVDRFAGDLADPDLAAAAVAGVDAVCHQAARVRLGVDFGDVRGYVAANDTGTAVLLDALWRRSFRGRLVLASSMVIYGEGRSDCAAHGPVTPGPASGHRSRRGSVRASLPRCRVPPARRLGASGGEHDTGSSQHLRHQAPPGASLRPLRARIGGDGRGAALPQRARAPDAPGHPICGRGLHFSQRPRVPAGRPRCSRTAARPRDFVHVRDVARANVLAMTDDSVPSGAYNIASGDPHTVGEMAAALAAAFGSAKDPVVSGRWRLGDVRHIVASPALAAERLGFRAEIGFAEGMAEFATAPLRW